MSNAVPQTDISIGHSAPIVADPAVRAKLLSQLKALAPNLTYEFIERAFKPTIVTVLAKHASGEHTQEEWSWVLPIKAGQWILTVEEFLASEIERLS